MLRLAIDIGNTRVKVGIYNDRNLENFTIVKKLTISFLNKLFKKFPCEYSAICASGSLDQNILEFLNRRSKVLLLSHDSLLPITLDYETPYSLGRDRIAAAIGAWSLFNGQHTAIVNMGTCITMDFVSANGQFKGGNISPGISMRLKTMHKFTARLPLVELELPESDLGTNTKKALQNGAIRGAFYEVETFISKLSEKYSHLNVVLAGGDAPMFEKYSKNNIFARPNIVLDGLIEVSINNQ